MASTGSTQLAVLCKTCRAGDLDVVANDLPTGTCLGPRGRLQVGTLARFRRGNRKEADAISYLISNLVSLSYSTVFIGEEDTMVNKILVVDKIVHLGPPLSHCRELLYKIVW